MCYFSGWMYSYFATLVVPAIVLGNIQILAALLAICLYACIKQKNKKVHADIILDVT